MALKLSACQILILLNQHLTKLVLQVNDSKSLQVAEIEFRDVLLLWLVVVLVKALQVNLPVFLTVNQSHLGLASLFLSFPLPSFLIHFVAI